MNPKLQQYNSYHYYYESGNYHKSAFYVRQKTNYRPKYKREKTCSGSIYNYMLSKSCHWFVTFHTAKSHG